MLAESTAAPILSVPSPPKSTTRGTPRAGGKTRGRPGDGLNLAQLLTSRMCHDLSGAIGVTASAEDLIGPGPELEADALALVADAGRRAAARLAFFRAAFGFGEASSGMLVSDVRALIEAAVGRPRLQFEWDGAASATAAHELPPLAARIILCLALIASEALPRGGTVRVRVVGGAAGFELVVEAEGTHARLTPQVLQAFRAANCQDLTSAAVVGYYVQMLAGRFAATVVTEIDDGRVRLSLSPARYGQDGCGPRRH